MYLIVGLGNPGTKYEKTRHNIGFSLIDTFLQKNTPSSSFQLNTRANAFVLDEVWRQEQLVFVKPQTFMNNSGKAIKVLHQKYKIKDWLSAIPGTLKIEQKHFQNYHGIFETSFRQENNLPSRKSLSPWRNERVSRYMIVVHDDLDLPLGKVKISLGSSSGGHNGVESIIKETKTKEFARIRIGIQPEDGKPAHAEELVVQRFTPEEIPVMNQATLNAVHALEMIITDGIEKAMNEYN